jgi:drug/metabolite transporter (DMT)-like permease
MACSKEAKIDARSLPTRTTSASAECVQCGTVAQQLPIFVSNKELEEVANHKNKKKNNPNNFFFRAQFDRYKKKKKIPMHLSNAWKGCIAAVCWISLNLLLQFANKMLFSSEHFEYPLLIIMVGMSTTGALSSVLVFGFSVEEFPVDALRRNWKTVAVLALGLGLGAGLQNMSIQLISISVNQVVKATAPALTMTLSFVWERKRYSRASILSCMVLVGGAVLCVLDNPEFHSLGFLFAVGSLLMQTVQTVAAGVLLQRERIQPLSLTCMCALPAVGALVPAFMATEYERLVAEELPHPERDFVAILVLGFMAFFYFLSGLMLVKYTSATYLAVLGCLKIILLIGLALIIWKTPLMLANIIGMVIAIAGFVMYNFARFRDNQQQQRRETAGDEQENSNKAVDDRQAGKQLSVAYPHRPQHHELRDDTVIELEE